MSRNDNHPIDDATQEAFRMLAKRRKCITENICIQCNHKGKPLNEYAFCKECENDLFGNT